ncbi:TPA: AAA family ATPase, partial [Acinetobacter baumannii]|nr:AAA family ATPase [Acinetobacter baumannii]
MSLITNEDIQYVENKLNLKLDEGSIEFLKCNITKDIQACPGAGKTTTLVAKLDILANKMPFPDKSGVLVLTHTNVAIDEIKSKLGYNANKLVSYPNHVGTFQSFVNKYLAIPMYIHYFGKKPLAIDSELFEKKLIALMESHWIGKILLERSQQQLMSIENYLDSLKVYENKIVLELSDGKNKTIVNNHRPFYAQLKSYLESEPVTTIVSRGYLTFNHCYELAEHYIEKNPDIANIISSRFKYVFIDETQDTDEQQFKLLKTIFEGSNSIVQKIGDNDQSIFNFEAANDLTWIIDDEPIKINETKRLSQNICKVASHFSITDHVLRSNNQIDINPIVIVFDDEKIDQVLPTFAKIIKQYNLHLEGRPIFKAIGSVGKMNGKHTLPSYISAHLITPIESSVNNDFETKISKCADKVKPAFINEIYWNLIIKYLIEHDIKNKNRNFTKNSLINYLKVNNKNLLDTLKLNSLAMFESIIQNRKFLSYLEESLNLISDFMGLNYENSILLTLTNNFKIPSIGNETEKFSFVIDDSKIDIGISTIHKAKGETHTATLVLETYRNGYDINQLLPLLKGDKCKGHVVKKKLLYVGMTRPTHLLCLALHKSYEKKS